MRNLTFVPSIDDLVLLPYRVSERAKAFAYYYGLDDIFGRIRGPGSFIAEPTLGKNATANVTKKFIVKETVAASTASWLEGTAGAQGLADEGTKFLAMSWNAWKSLGGFLPYVLSKWAITTVLMSFLINRTQFYASSRVPLSLWWPVRLGLYLLPILALLVQIHWLLQGIRCQTSLNFPQIRYGNSSKIFELDYAGEGGFLQHTSSALLFWESDEASCANVQMSKLDGVKPAGSLTLLWPLFLSICLTSFTEALASALQGRNPNADLNLVELSFAFNEAESMVIRPFESALNASIKEGNESATEALSRKILLRAMNVSPEMLLISLVWAMSNFSGMILAIFGLRYKYRLVNTGFWGTANFAAISRSVYMIATNPPASDGTRFGRVPTILLMGFLPHFIVIVGMLTCAFVYTAALVITSASLPPAAGAPATFRDRLSLAYRNLQANVHFSNATPLSFNMTDDFYTALLTAGFTVLTAASEAVYLNEGAKVRVSNLTWVERKRIQEMQQSFLFKKTRKAIPSELRAAINDRVETAIGNPQPSGYGVERKIRGQEREEALAAVRGNSGIHSVQRSGRWYLAMRLVSGTLWLILGFNAKLLLLFLQTCGIAWRPRWLVRAIAAPKRRNQPLQGTSQPSRRTRHSGLELIVFPDGEVVQASNENIDLEREFRRRGLPEQDVDDSLYSWWKQGGYWGNVDNSGDFIPSPQDDDTTSMISMSTNPPQSDDEWEDFDGSGRRTPTQRNPNTTSRESTPFEYDGAFDADQLARLLDPQDYEQQNEARMLARRLRKGGIMTRSQYNRDIILERTAVLTSSRYGQRLSLDAIGAPMSPDGEESALEQFIVMRRRASGNVVPRDSKSARDWENGAEGMGAQGPQCVVCQDAPRTILLWPCGCLCLCDNCRVNMAARNFGNCICCRTGTVAYSRLYVP